MPDAKYVLLVEDCVQATAGNMDWEHIRRGATFSHQEKETQTCFFRSDVILSAQKAFVGTHVAYCCESWLQTYELYFALFVFRADSKPSLSEQGKHCIMY